MRIARRRRRPGHLRGPLAGRRAGRAGARRRRRAARGDQRLALRAPQGRHPTGAGLPPRTRGGCGAGLREHGRRAGRARVRRRLLVVGVPTGSSSPAPRSSPRACWSSTSTCPAAAGTARSDPRRRPAAGLPGAPPPADRAAAHRRGGDVPRAGRRAARLRAQERLPVGHLRHVRWHRLRAGRRDRRRRDRRRRTCTASRCPAATPRSTPRTTRSTWPSVWARTIRRIPIAPIFDAFMASMELTGLAEENLQARDPRHDRHGAEQPGGPPGVRPGQQERAVGGLLDDLRRCRRRVRPDQGRPQDVGVPAGPLAQRRGRAPRARSRPSRRTRSTSPRRPSSDQTSVDTDSLPDYELLDDILDDYVEDDRGADELVAEGFDRALVERVLRMTDLAEYKRRQYPIGHQDHAPLVRPRPPPADHQPLPGDRRLSPAGRPRGARRRRADRARCGHCDWGNGTIQVSGDSFGSLEMGEIAHGLSAASGAPQSTTPTLYGADADGPPGDHPRSDRRQGAGREVADDHGLRRTHRAHLRRGRHPGDARRRLGRDGRLRVRLDCPGDRRRPAAPGGSRRPRLASARWSSATSRSAPTRPHPSRPWRPPPGS